MNTTVFGIVSSQALTNYAPCLFKCVITWGKQTRVNEGEADINRRSAPAGRQKQITVTSSEGAGANHFCKKWRCQGNEQKAGEVTVCRCIPQGFTR